MDQTDSQQDIKRITIIGNGNVGSHLGRAFRTAGCRVKMQSSRDSQYDISDSDLIIISVKDKFIAEVVERITESSTQSHSCIIVHTSGSVGMDVLQPAVKSGYGIGVLYPMQTFTKEVEMRYNDIPFLTEGQNHEIFERLKTLALRVSPCVIEADSGVRGKYHIGAVLTCNFANHLWALADDYLNDNNLSFDTLMPLLRQTVEKLRSTAPKDAQTGPAVRNDRNVIDRHLRVLESNKKLYELYSILSESIINHHK
ncbi:MAG: DUF2520 domain-containing protein [Muribaculaceae bacterium]|nr:DUF2520 domain-containing protein [Muribaculaceae bacterium]